MQNSKLDISVIMPALNEEKYLFLLLESIKKQNFSDYEIIVADGGSQDKTTNIAKKYNCKIMKGGLPAKGRNEGAKIAKGDLLLFLDADVFLPPKFLERVLKEFHQKKLEIAAFCLSPCKNRFFQLLFNIFYNFPIIFLEKILPHAAMGILINKGIFRKLNGFDEDIKIAEDHDLARRAKKIGKYGILKSEKIYISLRRFKKDGWFKTALKYLFFELYMIFKGPVKSEIFKYKFNHYKE